MYKVMNTKKFDQQQQEEEENSRATVKVERVIYNRLKLIVKRKEADIQTTVNKLVKNYVAKEELFEKYSPFLSIVNMEDSSLFIKDYKIGTLFEVILKYRDDKTDKIIFFCCTDKSEYCVHTAFAAASDVVGELKISQPSAKCN